YVDAQFRYAYNQNTGFADDPTIWTLVFNANWTLWDGGTRAAEMRDAASRVRSAELAARLSTQDAEEEVRLAWERFHRTSRAVEAVVREVRLAEESVERAERGFAAGINTWLEVEEAQLGLTNARLNAIRERSERDLAAIGLQVAMGTYL